VNYSFQELSMVKDQRPPGTYCGKRVRFTYLSPAGRVGFSIRRDLGWEVACAWSHSLYPDGAGSSKVLR
jgi:hypothetical protein